MAATKLATSGSRRFHARFLRLTPLQWAVLAVVLAGGGFLSFWAIGRFTGGPAASAATQLIPVQRGDISQTVSTNGSVAYSTRDNVLFSTPGTIGTVLVSEGQSVQQGDPIAALDDATVASLQRAVKEAEVSVRTAEERIADLQKAADPLALAQAEADLIGAQVTLMDAEKATDAALERALATAEAELAQTRAALRTAEDALAQVTGGTARARAEETVAIAAQALASAQADLRLAEQNRYEKLSTALTAVRDAEVKYRSIFQAWTGVRPTDSQMGQSPDALLASWGATYDSLIATASADDATQSDDPTTPWDEMVLFLWTHLVPTPIKGACTTPVPAQTRCMQAELEAAWSSVSTTRTAYDTTVTQQTNAVNAARTAVTKAEDSLSTAQRSLDDLKSDATAQARAADLALAKARLVEAEAKVDSSKDALGRGKASRMTNITLAKARVTSAEQRLADLQAVGKDQLAIELAQAQLAEAKTRLSTAQTAFKGVTATAPISGVVVRINVSEGQSVGLNTVIAEIVDRSVLEVAASVDEIDVLSISVGAEAAITMDALSGTTLRGTVTEIGDAASSSQGVVSYPITVRIEVPEGVTLREGLSATASVTIRSETGALLVPVQAVGGSFIRPTVKVMRDGKTQTVEVELGISDESWVAVRRGVQDGDRVVLEGSAVASADARLQQRAGQLGQGQLFGPQSGPQTFIAPGGAVPNFQQGTTGGQQRQQGQQGSRQDATGGQQRQQGQQGQGAR